jgi:hypothetical protein
MTNLIKSWNNRNIRIRGDRYVSLTDMAQATGKRVNNWLRLDSTNSYLKALESVTHLSATGLVQVIQGGDPQNQGTWGHPKVSLRFAQWCNDEFAVWVDCQIDELMTTGSVSITAKPQSSLAPFWYQRLLLDHKTNAVPNGYFSIFREVIPLVAELETVGYVLPDSAVPDISVGKTWANYLRTINIAVEQVARQYPHTYPDRRNVQPCNCYPESLLPTFRQWFREKYKVDHLQRYMKTKDQSALPAVDRIVKGLMAGV